LQKTHLHLGNEKPQMQSEFQKQFGAVDDLIEAAKNPSALDAAQKADLRAQHFYFGTDIGPNNSEAAEQFGARATGQGGEKALADERNNLANIRKDLRATHINLGTDDTKDTLSTAQEAYSHPIGKPVGGRTEDKHQDIDPQKVSWSVGIDDEGLRELRSTSMQHQDFADGVAKVNYGQLAHMDAETKADLRKSHFYFGKESFPKYSSSRDAFVAHKHQRHVIDPTLLQDLRSNHFTFGTDEGLGSHAKSTCQEAMIYHGAQAYRKESGGVAEMKKLWAKSSYNPGSHDGPRLSVHQSDFKYRPGL